MGFFITKPTNILLKRSSKEDFTHKKLDDIHKEESRKEESPTLLLRDDELAVTQHDDTNTKQKFDFGDVWYRRFLKPLTRQNRPVPYHVSFKRRMLRPRGIPVHELEGVHELFRPEFRQYSPMMGMIFAYNNFIDNIYRYGDPKEPATELVRSLFHALPGGDIQPTHLGSECGSHLSPSIVGAVFETFEEFKKTLFKMSQDEQFQSLENALLDLIGNHLEYNESRKQSLLELQAAQANLDALQRKDEESQLVRDKIKELEGLVIKKARHRIKHAEKALKKEIDSDRISELNQTIAKAKIESNEAKKIVEDLRADIVTSADFKEARKAVRRAQDMVDLEKKSLKQFADKLARSFLTYDIDEIRAEGLFLPKYSTTAILLGWIWSKYDSLEYLRGYFESMKQLNALDRDVTDDVFDRLSDTQSVSNDGVCFHFPRAGKLWSPSELEKAAWIVVQKPGVARRPPVVPFSYISWAEYSEFPDCGENALRNLFNQILFNPDTGKFDYALLEELRQTRYPRMKQKLIDFYQKHPSPDDSLSHQVAKDWIVVMSNLNEGVTGDGTVRYRREKQEQNIASPLKNVLRGFNALFGVRSLDRMILHELVKAINLLRSWDLEIDTTGVRDDGFGIVRLSDGNVRYELQSFKPVHFGFAQVETLNLDSLGRRDYQAFRRLRKKVSQSPGTDRYSSEYFEQLALASLFVPYDVEHQKTSKFFRKTQLHVWFSDLTLPSHQLYLDELAKKHPQDQALQGLSERVHSYVEPKFMPEKSK